MGTGCRCSLHLEEKMKRRNFVPKISAHVHILASDGKVPASLANLEEADFFECIFDGRPCKHAKSISLSLDGTATTMYCGGRMRQITPNETLGCTNKK